MKPEKWKISFNKKDKIWQLHKRDGHLPWRASRSKIRLVKEVVKDLRQIPIKSELTIMYKCGGIQDKRTYG